MSRLAQARQSRCSLLPQRKRAYGFSEVRLASFKLNRARPKITRPQAPFPSAKRERATSIIPARCIRLKVGKLSRRLTRLPDLTASGDLVTMHRKVHLFDIDIPGKITFKVGTLLNSAS